MADAQQGGGGTVPDFDFTRFFGDLKLPAGFDMQALAEATRRNVEAFTAANRIALDGAQSIARRQMEIMQQAFSELTEAMRSMSANETPQQRAARQAEMMKSAYQRAMANIQEVSAMIQRSNTEALALLNKRFTEAMDELRALAQKSE